MWLQHNTHSDLKQVRKMHTCMRLCDGNWSKQRYWFFQKPCKHNLLMRTISFWREMLCSFKRLTASSTFSFIPVAKYVMAATQIKACAWHVVQRDICTMRWIKPIITNNSCENFRQWLRIIFIMYISPEVTFVNHHDREFDHTKS